MTTRGAGGATDRCPGTFGLLERVAGEVPDRLALVEPFVRGLTFAEWLHDSVALAARLSEAGITSGMRVGLLFDRRHWIDLCVAYFAVQRLGAVTVTVSAGAPASVRDFITQDAGISAWIAADPSPVGNGPGGDPYQVLPVEPPRCGDRVPPPATTRPEQTADILYTSGTTGLPKAVVTPHALFTEVYARPPSAHGGIGPPILHAFPIGTAAALMMLYAPFQGIDGPGLTHPITRAVAALPEFNTNDVCKAVADCQVTLLFLTPAMLAHLTMLTSSQREMLASLEVIHCGSAPLNPAHVERIRRMLPSVRVVNAYGTTEAWPAMVEMPSAGADPDVVGRPARGTRIRIRSLETGLVVGPGVHGRVEMSCPRFRGRRSYLHDSVPSKTFLPDGWTATGDIGHLDEEGNLHLSDRVSDVLNVGGEKLSARPVEIALLSHPMVEAAAVLGLPHPRLGEYVAAVVVLRPGRTSLDDIRVHLLERLPPKQIPRRVFAVGSMPVTENGKILKNDLKNSIARGEGTLSELR
ncbi:class I adenylate-forming enzyme family protein [Micromonospora chalcea]|uniref:class I adenylate-forming enzyme family protein n=1 Tax=Micromonospora chalcea TaxID=1874 RepID=UPI0037229565